MNTDRKKEVQELIGRAQVRVTFLNTTFEICGKDGCDVTIPGFEARGLAIILKDIGPHTHIAAIRRENQQSVLKTSGHISQQGQPCSFLWT